MIEEIGYTSSRIKEKEEKEEKAEEEKAYLRLIKIFNKEAEKRKSPYRILMLCSYPHLYFLERWFFNLLENKKEISQIYHDKNTNQFSFIYGLTEEVFKAIEPIIININIKINVKLRTGEIPVKYKILKNLK